jgi:hypothetical protein
MATDVGRRGTTISRSEPAARRLTTETKSAFKTTELIAYVAVLVGLFVAGAVVDQADNGGLGARQVWLYAVILTVGYMISRGLAKSGSHDPYWSERGDRDADH